MREYVMYDPGNNRLEVYLRQAAQLNQQTLVNDRWTSPTLGIHLQHTLTDLLLFYPDGTPFRTAAELDQLRLEAEEQRREAEQQRHQAEQQRRQAEQQRRQAEQRATTAEEQRNQAEQQRRLAEQRLARQTELSRKLLRGEATPDELAELREMVEDSST